MYKKTFLFCVLFFSSAQYASDMTPWLELKPSYFLFPASPMHNVYKKGGIEVQASVSVPVCIYLDLYGSLGYRGAWGRALNTCEKTNLTVVPIDIGLKPIFNFCEKFYYFFAVGPRFFYVHQHNKSPYVDCMVNGGGVGLFVNTGFNVQLTEHFLFGLFTEYSYEKKKICPKMQNVYSNGSVQIGGFAFGFSLGYAF